MNKREAAQWYIERYHWHPVEVEPTTKKPVRDNWNQPVDDKDRNGFFEDDRLNIGILLGDPYNLTDIDIDAHEARWAWIEYAVPTGLTFGHASKPASHHFYYSDPAARTAKYNDPAAGEGQQACLIELRCLTRDGKIGFQTIVPPSIHVSGEPIEFTHGAGHPANVDKEVIERAVRYTAAAALFGRHARKGRYHETFIALAGALRRAEWPLADAQRFLRAIYRVIWHDKADLYQAEQDVNSTYQRFDDGGDTTGLRTLANLIDEKVYRTLKQWLGLEAQEAWMHEQARPQKPERVLPKAYTFDSLRSLVIPGSETLVEDMLVTPGLTLMVGASKSGKTVLACQMAMCLASGLQLFDNYTTQQANGLIVEWDDRRGPSSLKAFVAKARASREGQPLHWSVKEPEHEDSLINFTLSDPEFVPWLKNMIEETQARLVILDSYTALRGFHSAGKDIVKVEATELSALNRLAVEMGCAFILIHHTSKGASTQERHSRSAGTFAMQAVSEAQIVVERFRDLGEEDTARLVSVRGRHLRGAQMVLRFQESTLDFDLVLTGPASERFPRLRKLLHAFRGKAFTITDVNQDLGWAKTQIYDLLSDLVSADILVKTDKKTWNWAISARSTLESI
jgi:hypothetical protein